MSKVLPILIPLLLCTLAACDSTSNSTPAVQYFARGTCDGPAGANVVSVSYTADGGNTESASVTMPWSLTESIDDLGVDSLGNSRTHVDLSVMCVGSGLQPNSITGEIWIDGTLVDSDIQSNQATVIVSVGARLPD